MNSRQAIDNIFLNCYLISWGNSDAWEPLTEKLRPALPRDGEELREKVLGQLACFHCSASTSRLGLVRQGQAGSSNKK